MWYKDFPWINPFPDVTMIGNFHWIIKLAYLSSQKKHSRKQMNRLCSSQYGQGYCILTKNSQILVPWSNMKSHIYYTSTIGWLGSLLYVSSLRTSLISQILSRYEGPWVEDRYPSIEPMLTTLLAFPNCCGPLHKCHWWFSECFCYLIYLFKLYFFFQWQG